MIITVGNTKGGVGKTTLAVQLALRAALDGRDIWLIDADRQGTATAAIAARAEAGREPKISCAQYADGPSLRGQVSAQRHRYGDIIVDAGGRDSAALRAALVLSDVLVVPFQPRSFDVWAMDDIAQLISEALSVRDGLAAYAVMNLADPGDRGTDNMDAADAVSGIPHLHYLPLPLRRRKAFASASGAGLAVSEAQPIDKKAVLELDALYQYLFNMEIIVARGDS